MNKIRIFYTNEKYKLSKKYESDAAYDLCARLNNKLTINPLRKIIDTHRNQDQITLLLGS